MVKINTSFDGKNTRLKNVSCLDLPLTLDCGQAFRWKPGDDGAWHGIAKGKKLKILQNGDEIILFDTTLEDYKAVWEDYFDMARDYDSILKGFCEDELLCETVKKYYGIRILKQDSFEALFTFIFSSSNNIKRIKGFVEKIAQNYGTPLGSGSFAFPTAQQLKNVTAADYRALGAGYRDVFLEDCVKRVIGGETDLEKIKKMPVDKAREELMLIKGVGRKVADCTLLFGFNFVDCFPIDRWIKRILELYPNGLPECFKGYEGIAQQYMFHYARMNLTAEKDK